MPDIPLFPIALGFGVRGVNLVETDINETSISLFGMKDHIGVDRFVNRAQKMDGRLGRNPSTVLWAMHPMLCCPVHNLHLVVAALRLYLARETMSLAPLQSTVAIQRLFARSFPY